MTLPKPAFPLPVDFSDAEYWIGNQGPFKYGSAVTAFSPERTPPLFSPKAIPRSGSWKSI